MTRVAILGGHGKVALLLAERLSNDGHDVASFFRNPDHLAEVAATGATPVVLDLERASVDDLVEQFEGHDAVVWSAGAGGGDPRRTYAVDRDAAIRSMDAADRAGVRRYVMISYLGAGTDHGVPEDSTFFPYAEAKAAADTYLRRSPLDWTILGPGNLTEEDPSGRITPNPDPATDGRDTSRGNVARVARAVLTEPQTVRTTIAFVDGETTIGEALLDGVEG